MTTDFKEKSRSKAMDMADHHGVRRPGILIADEMTLVLTSLQFEMGLRGFNVWLAGNGDDALELYQRHGEEIDLVLLAVRLPGLDGPRTLEVLQVFNPQVVACFMTGSSEAYTEEDLLEWGAACVFPKPFHPAEVGEVLQQLVSTPDSLHW